MLLGGIMKLLSKGLTALLFATSLTGTQNAHAFLDKLFGTIPAEDPPIEAPLDPTSGLGLETGGSNQVIDESLLRELKFKMTAEISTLEEMLMGNNPKLVMEEAKKLYNDVNSRIGIDPRANLKKPILVALKFPTSARAIRDLNESEQENLINQINQYQSGLYLDIINLAKRTQLIYVEALKKYYLANPSKSKQLLQSDVNKMVDVLIKAIAFPILIKSKNSISMTVYADEVANDDHIHLFDRPIKLFLIDNNILNESEIDQKIMDFKNKSQGVSITPPAPQVTESDIDSCYASANKYGSFDKEETQKKVCFDKFKASFTRENCQKLAKRFGSIATETYGLDECLKLYPH
jgi:hypothetical protein